MLTARNLLGFLGAVGNVDEALLKKTLNDLEDLLGIAPPGLQVRGEKGFKR